MSRPRSTQIKSDSADALPQIAVQQLAQSSKAVGEALHSGKVIRVLGPKHLLKGLDNRSLELVSTSTGKVGTVRHATSKPFAGQLRLGQGGAANAAKMTVSAGFAVASAVTMQYYLASIDSKLGSTRHGLEGLQSDVLDEQLGKIDSTHEVCREFRSGGSTRPGPTWVDPKRSSQPLSTPRSSCAA